MEKIVWSKDSWYVTLCDECPTPMDVGHSHNGIIVKVTSHRSYQTVKHWHCHRFWGRDRSVHELVGIAIEYVLNSIQAAKEYEEQVNEAVAIAEETAQILTSLS